MSDEANFIQQLTHLIRVMARLAKGTAEASAVRDDLAVLNPNASPLPFYFTVQAADANLFEQVASMGRGHRAFVVADKIYSDEGFLQQNWNYWPSVTDFRSASGAGDTLAIIDSAGSNTHDARGGHSVNVALFGSHIASFTAQGDGGGYLVTSAAQTETVPPLFVHPHG
jgi:hypothetical protein